MIKENKVDMPEFLTGHSAVNAAKASGNDRIKENGNEKDGEAQDNAVRYDPKFWNRCRWMTVGQFCDYLKKNIPEEAMVHICGCDEFYTHLSEDGGMFILDDCALSDLPEYEGAEPKEFTGSEDTQDGQNG